MNSNPQIVIDLQILYKSWEPVLELHKNALIEVCETCLNDEYKMGFPQYPLLPQDRTYELSIILVNNVKIQELNREWRQKDKATNILSFSAVEGESIFPPDMPILLGDLIVAYERVKEEAESANISFIDHLKRLIIHGMFHLLGYDHIKDEEFVQMAKREYKLLKKLHIYDYIDDLTLD